MLPNHYQSVENITALERGMSSNYTQAAVLSEALASSYGEGDLRLDAYFKPADKMAIVSARRVEKMISVVLSV